MVEARVSVVNRLAHSPPAAAISRVDQAARVTPGRRRPVRTPSSTSRGPVPRHARAQPVAGDRGLRAGARAVRCQEHAAGHDAHVDAGKHVGDADAAADAMLARAIASKPCVISHRGQPARNSSCPPNIRPRVRIDGGSGRRVTQKLLHPHRVLGASCRTHWSSVDLPYRSVASQFL